MPDTTDDVNGTNNHIANKRLAKTPIFRIHNGKQAIVLLEDDDIERLRLTRQDFLYKEITPNGIFLCTSNNKTAAGSGYQADPADDSEDSRLDYHDEHV